jgi:tRNA-specific 2-thiouridylase
MYKKDKKKIFVGLSGGVDSSTTAALLKEEGHDITGVFIKVWQPDFLECSWKEDRTDAMRVCALLDIPFKTLDLGEEYKKEVVDYMIREYKAGRTPNPDVFCNKHIKFGAFLDWAKKQGVDFVATGHYARIVQGQGASSLLTGVDGNKDQSYFLWTLTQNQLKNILFPVGGYLKSEVRKLAEKFDLPTAKKKDSQGLCFVGKVDMYEFLSNFIDQKEGNVVDGSGNVIGKHTGSEFYTIGQRHGFTIYANKPNEMPHYVVSKNIERNTITVSTDLEKAKTKYDKTKIILKDVNWINTLPETDKRYQGRFRYRQMLQYCYVKKISTDGVIVEFEREQVLIPEGQSFVLYDGETVLGGGIVEYIKK